MDSHDGIISDDLILLSENEDLRNKMLKSRHDLDQNDNYRPISPTCIIIMAMRARQQKIDLEL